MIETTRLSSRRCSTDGERLFDFYALGAEKLRMSASQNTALLESRTDGHNMGFGKLWQVDTTPPRRRLGIQSFYVTYVPYPFMVRHRTSSGNVSLTRFTYQPALSHSFASLTVRYTRPAA